MSTMKTGYIVYIFITLIGTKVRIEPHWPLPEFGTESRGCIGIKRKFCLTDFHVYYRAMDNEIAAKRLAELGHNTRLLIFRYLVKVGDEGAPVGQIQNKLGIPNSTLSHHINRLVSVGLIRQIRDSRTLYCVPQFEVLRELIDFLQAECCTEGKCKI